MLKNNILESLQEVQEILENNEFEELINEQKKALQDNFNRVINFEYCEDGGYIFLMPENTFKDFEYYIGMEYETEFIDTKFSLNGNILVIYDYDCSRAKDLFELLEENEK